MEPRLNKSHGSGVFQLGDFKSLGKNVIIEKGVKVFHPDNIKIGDNVYIGHNTILKSYHNSQLEIGDNTWIGQNCYFHSAGGLKIGKNVGIGPNVQILTSSHDISNEISGPILFQPINFAEVIIEDGVDIGVSSVVLPGVTIGKYTQIGAMSLVNKDINTKKIAYGSPCREVKDIIWKEV